MSCSTCQLNKPSGKVLTSERSYPLTSDKFPLDPKKKTSSGNFHDETVQPSPIARMTKSHRNLPELNADPMIKKSSRKKLSENKMDYLAVAEFDNTSEPPTLLNFEETFKDVKILGKGGFGEVHLVTGPKGQKYALKILIDADLEILRDETKTISYISHAPNCNPDIVCFYKAFQFDRKGEMVYGILTEFINGYDLTDVKKHREKLDAQLIFYIGLWLLKVIADLHRKHFVHRDIKPGNIMWNNDKNFVTLIDFGLSCVRPCDETLCVPAAKKASVCLGGKAGTLFYMPPELLYARSIDLKNDHDYMMEVYRGYDIFAIGITLYELLEDHINNIANGSPFKLDKNYKVVDYKYIPLKNVDKEFDDIIRDLVREDPDERLTADEGYKRMENYGKTKKWV